MPSPTTAPPKKKTSGCVVAALVAFAGLVLVGAAAAVALVSFSRTREGRRFFAVMGESVKIVSAARSAPGAAEVKKAGPCLQAFVVDLDGFRKLAELVDEDGGTPPAAPEGAHTVVSCVVGFAARPPSCDALARVYADAIGGAAPAPFSVVVQRQGAKEPACTVVYAPDGTR